MNDDVKNSFQLEAPRAAIEHYLFGAARSLLLLPRSDVRIEKKPGCIRLIYLMRTDVRESRTLSAKQQKPVGIFSSS